MAVLASALVRPALVLTAVCSARRWLVPEPTMVVECASCRPFCWLLVVEGAEAVSGATLRCNSPRAIDAEQKTRRDPEEARARANSRVQQHPHVWLRRSHEL
jgi:hypothetical protein